MSLENFDYINRTGQAPHPPQLANSISWFRPSLFIALATIFCASFVMGRLVINLVSQKTNRPNIQTQQTSSNSPIANIQPQTDTLLTTTASDDSPIVARVAGATTDENTITQQTSFATVKSNRENTCSTRTLFAIGEVETSLGAHPSDELNWVGALDVLPEYPDPFIVNTHSADSFPWRSNLPVAKPINIIFDLPNENLQLELLVGWDLGNQGSKSINVKIDQQSLGTTPVYQAELSQDSYQQMKFVENKFTLPSLAQGTHQLSLEPLITTGDPLLFDYIFLVETCPTE